MSIVNPAVLVSWILVMSTTAWAECACHLAGDVNVDGVVDPLDVGYVLSRFGCPIGSGDETCDRADANQDLAVDPLDTGFVLSRLGMDASTCDQGPLFSTPAFEVGYEANDLALADLNFDCLPEIITSQNSGDIWITSVDEWGGYGAPIILDPSSGPGTLSIGDFDADGDPDIALTTDEAPEGCGIYLFLNDEGSLHFAFHSPADCFMSEIIAGDLNGDGADDLVARLLYESGVLVMINEGNGEFRAAATYWASYHPNALGLSDLDGDGDLDIAETTTNDRLVLLFNDGDGSFDSQFKIVSVGVDLQGLALEDLNGDGWQDIVIVNPDDQNLLILTNNGDGNLAEPVPIEVSGAPTLVSGGDADGNGDVDLFVYFEADQAGQLLKNLGQGTSFEVLQLNRQFSAAEIVGGDLNFDGFSDFAVRPSEDDFGFGFLGNRERGVEDCGFSSALVPVDLDAGDLDGDGDVDLLTSYDLLINEGSGTFTSSSLGSLAADRDGVVIADMDNDGDGDAAITVTYPGPDPDRIAIMKNNGGGAFEPEVYFGDLRFPTSLAVGDLDSDGDLDIVANNLLLYRISVLINDGAGNLVESKLEVGDPARSIVLGDLDGDGDLDIVTVSYEAGSFSVFLNEGEGTFAPWVDYPAGGSPMQVMLGDFDGDGVIDVICPQLSQSATISFGSGDGTFSPPVDLGAGVSHEDGTVADIDGDGDLDLLLADEHEDVVTRLINDGTGNFVEVGQYKAGHYAAAVSAADFNGDGQIDFATANYDDGNVSIFLRRPTP